MLVWNLNTLLDSGFLLVRRNHAWCRNDFATTFSFQCRQFEINEVVTFKGIPYAEANRFDLYKDILLYRSREELVERLLDLGVDVSVSSLGRVEGEIAFVVGAVYPDESVSQIWFDRETFLPMRWIIRGNGGTSASDVLEIRYLTWWKSGQSRYPSRIEVYQDGNLVRVNQLKIFREDNGFSEELFDIDHLRAVYPLVPEQSLVPGEPEEPSEVQKTIEEFRRVFE